MFHNRIALCVITFHRGVVVVDEIDGAAEHQPPAEQMPDVDNPSVDGNSSAVDPTVSAPDSKPEPAPKARKRTKAADTKPATDVAVDVHALQKQLATLADQLSETKNLLTTEQEQRQSAEMAVAQAKENARAKWLEESGIIKPEYMQHAPGVEAGGDALTEDGRRTLARWRNEHPELFTGAPKPPDVVEENPAFSYGPKQWGAWFKRRSQGLTND